MRGEWTHRAAIGAYLNSKHANHGSHGRLAAAEPPIFTISKLTGQGRRKEQEDLFESQVSLSIRLELPMNDTC